MNRKTVVLTIVSVLAAAAVAIFFWRYQILQYSIEKIIRNNLPPYVKIDSMSFDLKGGKALFKGFRIKNPDGFSYEFLLTIDEISCRYEMRGRSIAHGIRILEPVFRSGSLDIERMPDNRVNLTQMPAVLEARPGAGGQAGPARTALPSTEKKRTARRDSGPLNIRLPDLIKLPEEFTVKSGRVMFVDRMVSRRPHMIAFDNIEAKIYLKLDDSYSKVMRFASTGRGNLGQDKNQVIEWNISLNPDTPRLTMSNRFEVSNVDMPAFEPYYDRYSPIVFRQGRFSGTIIFDFDNGSIGSTNEVRLSDIVFWIKPGYENAAFWETTVPELVRYFASPYGDIVFDFKIKGDMTKPQFYLGPISKRALASMAVDKISTIIQQVSQKEGQPGDGDKVKNYIGLFKSLVGKQ